MQQANYSPIAQQQLKQLETKKSPIGSIIAAIVTLFFVGLTIWAWVNKQYVFDLVSVIRYTPSAQVTNIVANSTMTDRAKFDFYASQPSVQSANDFNSNCKKLQEYTAVLGCYNNSKIYIYNITNSELNGIINVTASHEMLHAVWARMSDSEKQKITVLLEQAYNKLNNDNLKKTMSYYDKTEKDQRDNELHSILGTEYGNIGSDLEKYYSQYFSDRSALVTMYNKYQSIFDNIQKQSDQIASQLNSMATLLNKEIASYNQTVKNLNVDISQLNNSAKTIDKADEQAVANFNNKRQQILDSISSANESKQKIDSNTATYNNLLNQYNQLTIKSNELNSSIDSTINLSEL
jgi:chromosome segregation ATPase